MPSGIKRFTKIQIGKESTRGTLVAATRRILTRDGRYRRMQEGDTFENEISGTLSRSATVQLITKEWTELQLTMPVDFDQILFALLAGMKGGVTPTTPGTGEARLWTFTPADADPAPDTYTLEFDEADAGANDAEMEAGYGFVTGFTIKAGDNGVADMVIDVVARTTVDSTVTGSLTVPLLERTPSLRWGMWMDDTWAALGTNQVLGQVYGFEYKFSFLQPGFYQDARDDLSFNNYEFGGGKRAELTLDVVHDPASAKLVQTEEGKKGTATTAPVRRFIRLQANGSAFVAPDTALRRFVRIEGSYVHDIDSIRERGADRNGNLMTRLHMLSVYDPTSGFDIRHVVQNKLATFP